MAMADTPATNSRSLFFWLFRIILAVLVFALIMWGLPFLLKFGDIVWPLVIVFEIAILFGLSVLDYRWWTRTRSGLDDLLGWAYRIDFTALAFCVVWFGLPWLLELGGITVPVLIVFLVACLAAIIAFTHYWWQHGFPSAPPA